MKKVIFLVLIVWGRCLVWDWFYNESLLKVFEENIEYEVAGEICLEPDVRREDVRYVVCVDDFVDVDSFWDGRILWKSTFNEELNIGDEVVLNCVLEVPFEEDGFSYRNYLRIFRVVALCDGNLVSVDKFDDGFGWVWSKRVLLEFKWFVLKFFDKRLQEPVSSLVNGILLGSRRGFADNVMEDFAKTGLTHIIAVSGYNIALVIVCVDWLFAWVPRRSRVWLHVLMLVCFTFVTGLSASVIRAMIMGILSLWAMQVGRVKTFLRILLMTVLVMFLWNPAFLFYDVGFHLSVLATCGVVFGGWVMSWFGKMGESNDEVKDFLGLKEAFVMTLFAQVFTLPLIILKFDYLSVVSPLANVVVAPLLPFMMLVSVIMFCFGWLFGWLEFLCVLLLDVYGRLFFWLVEICAGMDWLIWSLEGWDRGFVAGVYCFLLLVAFVWMGSVMTNIKKARSV